MRLRTKPKKPTRRKVKDKFAVYDADTIGELLDHFGEGVDPYSIKLEMEYWSGGDHTLYAYHMREETDEEFSKRMNYYIRQKRAYDKWFEENKEAIEKELEARKLKKEEAAKTRAAKLKKRLENEKKKIEKKLKALNTT